MALLVQGGGGAFLGFPAGGKIGPKPIPGNPQVSQVTPEGVDFVLEGLHPLDRSFLQPGRQVAVGVKLGV
jgi:hypothetical protein